MSRKSPTLLMALCLGQPARAHAPAAANATRPGTLIHENTFEAGVATATVKAALTPSASLSPREGLSLLVLMSVPRTATRNPIQGAKP